MKSSYDTDGFLDVFARMSELLSGHHAATSAAACRRFSAAMLDAAMPDKSPNGFRSINLSQQDTWQFPLKTLPRPTGRSTQVIFTEYDLPEAHIHAA